MIKNIKHITLLKLFGFFFLLAIMFVLNNRIEKNNVDVVDHTETVQEIETNNNGIAPLSAQVPTTTEGTLPLKLISNPNSNFLLFVNHGFEHITKYNYIDLKNRYLTYCARIWANNISIIVITLRNRDIQ